MDPQILRQQQDELRRWQNQQQQQQQQQQYRGQHPLPVARAEDDSLEQHPPPIPQPQQSSIGYMNIASGQVVAVPSPQSVWTCPQCTFLNEAAHLVCGACGAERPHVSPDMLESPRQASFDPHMVSMDEWQADQQSWQQHRQRQQQTIPGGGRRRQRGSASSSSACVVT